MGLTQKQETFTVEYFKTGDATKSAITAGYKPKFVATHTTRWLKMAKIQQRLQELRDKLADEAVMDQREILERNTEIARARMSDFMECGADGSWINIGLDGCQSAALQEVISRTEYNEKGSNPVLITKIKLHDPVRSMDQISRIRGYYKPEGGNTYNINVDKVVIDARGKLEDALSRLALRAGEVDISKGTD